MHLVNRDLVLLLQRVIELLAFYLILSNINGNDLKTSFMQLVRTKQKILYGNILVLIVYPLAITYVIRAVADPQSGYSIDHLVRTLVLLLLTRYDFSVKKFLLTFILSMGIGFILSPFSLLFSWDGTFSLLCVLSIVILMAHRNYFENIYAQLLKRNRFFNAVLILSMLLYLTPFFIQPLPIIYSILFSVTVLYLALVFHLRKETLIIIERIKSSSSENFMDTLKELSSEYIESPLVQQYMIKNYHSESISPLLSKKLDFYKRIGTVQDYEYIVTKRQIKINVIL